jgi:hypothetical protein
LKNKGFTYLLGIVVLVVWGLIIYRVFAAAGGDDDPLPVSGFKVSAEPYNDFALAPDTTRLLLNYRDPFGLVKPKDTIAPVRRARITTGIKPMPKPAFNWDFIQYSGYMYNPVSKKLVTLVSINGRNEMLTEGSMKDNVKLIKNMRDSIKISYNGMVKFITRKQ